jgi:phosphoglycolate phosphatase-like HAD superfamily hydrolase
MQTVQMLLKHLLIFDLDGPILDVSEKYYRLYCDIVREYGGLAISKDDYWICKRQRIPETIILQRSGLTGSETDFQILRKERIESEPYLAHDRVWPEAITMLTELAEFHSLYLVTLRHDRASLIHELDRLKLRSYFQIVFSAPSDSSAHEHSETKVQLVREVFPADSFTGWFIGDTATDILAGKKLGINTVAVSYGIRTPAEFEILVPDLVVHTPNELARWSKTLHVFNS